MSGRTKAVIAALAAFLALCAAAVWLFFFPGLLSGPALEEKAPAAAAGSKTAPAATKGLQKESTEPPEAKSAELEQGDLAPDFSVELLEGGTFTLSEHRGKVVFLNFWATWCPPCVAEMPAIQELSELYEDEAVFIGVDIAEDTERVREFIETAGYTYDIGLDADGGISGFLYPSLGIPYTLVIDAEGIISQIFLGGGDQMHEVFDEAINKALESGGQ